MELNNITVEVFHNDNPQDCQYISIDNLQHVKKSLTSNDVTIAINVLQCLVNKGIIKEISILDEEMNSNNLWKPSDFLSPPEANNLEI